MLHHPLCVTLDFFQGDELSELIALVDASLLESLVSVGSMVVTANKVGEVCQIAKLGGVPVEALELMGYVQLAVRKAKELDAVMKAALEADAKKRDLGGLFAELSAENAR